MPVRVFEPAVPTVTAPSLPEQRPAPAPTRSQSGLIEIELGNGRQMRVGSDVNLVAAARAGGVAWAGGRRCVP